MTDKQDETVSKIAQITEQPEIIEVGEVEFTIHPLTNNEFLNFIAQRNQDRNDSEEVMVGLVTKILQKDDDSITREEVEEAPMELTIKVVEAMEQVNGLEDFFETVENEMQSQQR